LDIFQNAVEESSPGRLLPSRIRWTGKGLRGEGFHLDLGAGRTLVLSYGKASASMARALAAVLPPGKIDGFIVLPRGERQPRIPGLRFLAASHPVPDAGSFLGGGDTFRPFTALGDAVVTGRTGANLRDLYILLESPGTAGRVRGASGDPRG